ncbi:CaiF/GrlA family transcriptional regulator [Photorhabdus noenieputensis]|uniref:CaiF/GrlA family transcriptional regulator n=1 Tax=Photorhabdus noenieputensis TaxID=1208607 RepID=UPI001BD5043E|nr:CaiF/GrlA family transcriptional regulator [Photorhabdus noenieputensis]MBS9438305.1 CaiF/GrlA family transcriptional regulator [Photorhabdus noenieputensis]MCK3669835.1 CaiF/GrlA family transcriptional regulator [Photorhabdus noenieputensis]
MTINVNDSMALQMSGSQADLLGSQTITGKQSNHGDFRLPVCLSHLNDTPLYMAVAYWGLLKGRGFTKSEISQVFRVSERRARDVMNYIYNERRDVISCEKVFFREKHGSRRLMLIVTAVVKPMPQRNPILVTKTVKSARSLTSSRIHHMRTWFLQRACGPFIS